MFDDHFSRNFDNVLSIKREGREGGREKKIRGDQKKQVVGKTYTRNLNSKLSRNYLINRHFLSFLISLPLSQFVFPSLFSRFFHSTFTRGQNSLLFRLSDLSFFCCFHPLPPFCFFFFSLSLTLCVPFFTRT